MFVCLLIPGYVVVVAGCAGQRLGFLQCAVGCCRLSGSNWIWVFSSACICNRGILFDAEFSVSQLPQCMTVLHPLKILIRLQGCTKGRGRWGSCPTRFWQIRRRRRAAAARHHVPHYYLPPRIFDPWCIPEMVI